ncbi:MAG: biotin carboxylase N-terminal domain-containing protein, partial [Planctomycetota bacterium]|nr:biotin carboxylase N-terminal domain-containing protein [Planctomycetota bacterium]
MKKQKKRGPIRKVLIANRGEIALRIIRGCHEKGIKTVAVYSDADRWANYVSQAQESHFIGEAPASESYLRIDKLLKIAKKTGADQLSFWVGDGTDKVEVTTGTLSTNTWYHIVGVNN